MACDDGSDPFFKVEMKTLSLSDEATERILDTLKFIHGEDFMHKQKSSYRDGGKQLDRQYWTDRGSLIVHGIDNNLNKEPQNYSVERVNQFAMTKLTQYGFHGKHCSEALAVAKGDVGRAFELLMSRYFCLDLPSKAEPTPPALLQERSQELESIRSIYGDICQEKLPNQLWVVRLNLVYISDHYLGKASSIFRRHLPRKDNRRVCRFFSQGIHCRFGKSCKYSHEARVLEPLPFDETRDLYDLEIRFPEGSKYPLEAPLTALVSVDPQIPKSGLLKITRRLLDEALKSATLQQPSVHLLIELLLHREEEIMNLITGKSTAFYDPSARLFMGPEQTAGSDEGKESDHLYAGQSSRRENAEPEASHLRNNRVLRENHMRKQQDPKFQEMLYMRQKLPAWSKQGDVIDTIMKNQVSVISGETGCGKSTQIPQFLLDYWLNSNDDTHVDIICTQPRRISALGVAERVAHERCERVGDSIGYQIRLESKMSPNTRVLFCTTGILLRRLESDPKLRNVTHVIVDEVHERSEESDFLLMLLKEILPTRPGLKVVLMSATLNAELFTNFFTGAPILEIPGRTFPVEPFFLEDILVMTQYSLEESSRYARNVTKSASRDLETLEYSDEETLQSLKGYSAPLGHTPDEFLPAKQVFYRYKNYPPIVARTMYLTDAEVINFELIVHLLEFIVCGNHRFPREGSILVFLPGLSDITTLIATLEGTPMFSREAGRFLIIPLHSTLTTEEQSQVFRKPKRGTRKIVLSTNIAETSITIDDCVFVIDTGKMKEKGFDPNKNMESLEVVWISKANALQRRGRAGRVMPGVAFHLFPKIRFENVLSPQPVPEICRAPLEALILRIRTLPAFATKDIFNVINNLLEPPAQENVTSAIARLRNVGALDEASCLTPLGRHLATLPVDVRIGKLILFGAVFSALDSALTIAAFLTHKSPFVAPLSKKNEAEARKKEFVTANSDHLTILRAYKGWQKSVERYGSRGGYSFAQDNFLSTKVLHTLVDMKIQFLELLIDIGFLPGDIRVPRKRTGCDRIAECTGRELNENNDNPKVLASILCGALFPNIVKVYTPDKQYQQSVGGAIPTELRPDELMFKTKCDGRVTIHPASVNHDISNFASPYLVFQEKIKTSRVFIRECTMVPILPLVLFSGGAIKVELNCGEWALSLDDGWIVFSVTTNKIAELLENIKHELDELLEEKIKEPRMNLHTHPRGRRILSTIVYLISTA